MSKQTTRFRPLLPAFAGVALLAMATGCPPDDGGGIPEPDVCLEPGAGPVATVEIGHATLTSVFEPWIDDQQIDLVFGTQGSAMVPFRVRVQGTEETCLTVDITMVDASGMQWLDLSYPLQLYSQDDGSLISDTNFAIFDSFGAPNVTEVTLDVTVSGMTITRTIGVR